VPVVPLVASRGQGVEALREKIVSLVEGSTGRPAPRRFCRLPETLAREVQSIADQHAKTTPVCATEAGAEALLILSDENALVSSPQHYPRDTEQAVAAARRRLENAGLDWRSAAIEARYAR